MKSQFRRRRQGSTDYLKRKKLLKSGIPRIAFRRTNRYIIAQYISSKEAKDTIEIGVNSKNLSKYGWPEEFAGSLSSIPAAYLTGFLMGRKIVDGKKTVPIFDFGRVSTMHKTKPYAFLKGLVDAGVEMNYKDDEIFPEDERISGKSMKKDFSKEFEKIKSNIESEK